MNLDRINDRQRQVLAGLAAMVLLGLLLWLVSLDDRFQPEPPPLITLREVQMYTPPPPPPPPPVEQNTSGGAAPSMTNANVNNRIELSLMDLDLQVEAGTMGDFGNGTVGVGEGFGPGGMGTGFGFSELDGIPMVVSAPFYTYPEALVEQGIREFTVRFHMRIDEEGYGYPLRIISNPVPSQNEEALEYASRARFTPPTRLGVPTVAEYIWPVIFRYRANDE